MHCERALLINTGQNNVRNVWISYIGVRMLPLQTSFSSKQWVKPADLHFALEGMNIEIG